MPDRVEPNLIRKEISAIEEEHGVQVLLAVEYGSRAWGLDGPASDHDIRFIYRDPPEVAFSLYEDREMLSRRAKLPGSIGRIETDFVGWSLPKALKLAIASNPQLNEYLASPTTYQEDADFRRDLEIVCAAASPRVMAHYYRGNAKKNLLGRVREQEQPPVKATLQMVRGLLSSLWFVQNPDQAGFPPLKLADLRGAVDLAGRKNALPGTDAEIERLVELKTTSAKREPTDRFTMVKQWALAEIQALDREVLDLPDPWVDQELAESAFRRQYPETFLRAEQPAVPTPC